MATERQRLVGAWTYVLLSDRTLPAEKISRFTLRPLSSGERDFYRDHMSRTVKAPNGTEEKINNTAQMARALCLTHIESVENFPAGSPRRWPPDPDAREEYLDRLEDGHVIELGVEIFTRSFLGVEERQQLGESSPPMDTPSSVGA